MRSATASTPSMSSDSPLTGPRRSVARPPILIPTVTRPPSSRCTAGTGSTMKMDRRAIACFDQALADVGLAKDGALREVLHDYFAWATTTTMSRYHRSADDVPNGLSIPHWSWDGLRA